jgi:serine/threonine protein kinase
MHYAQNMKSKENGLAILQQIKKDAEYLRELISNLTSDRHVTTNGVRLTGQQLERTLAQTRRSLGADLKSLELILESGILPKKYQSIITKQTYYPSAEELKKQSETVLPANHSFFPLKCSRKDTKAPRSKYILVHDDASPVLNFFIEHQEKKAYPKGGFAAKVKKGYLQKDTEEAQLAIKIYHKDVFHGNSIHELRVAMRAAYCYKQFKREGYTFRAKNTQFMVTEWLSGATLAEADTDQIQSMPISRRIIMAISLLRELNILHQQGLIHNDIKPSNVMVNFGKLNFVDLDSVRPKNEPPINNISLLYTSSFLPTPQMSFDATYNAEDLYLKFDEQTDLYALGLTLIMLFPEIYTLKNEKRSVPINNTDKTFTFDTFSVMRGPKYAEHPKLQKILKNLVFHEQEVLNTAEDYIEALKDVLPNYPNYKQFLHEDTRLDQGISLSAEDGEKAFKEIEFEILGYNQRVETFNKVSLKM